jgi:glycosyltransferase involved in cell wall biosynthesis
MPDSELNLRRRELGSSSHGSDGHAEELERRPTRPLRVAHVISGLGRAGAEMMLLRLVAASDSRDFAHEVFSLTGLGSVGEDIRRLGVPTHALRMRQGPFPVPNPVKVARLAWLIARFRPDVVQTWMYHADLLGGLAGRFASDAKICWGIHNSSLDPVHTRRTTRWTVALCARVAHRVPDRIVAVSYASRDLHVSLGYDARKFTVIPNGFDLAVFRADPAARRAVRAELGLPEAATAVGLIGRFAPQKDHANFIRAAAILAARRPDVRFVLCGSAATESNAALAGAIARHGLLARFHLLGSRRDVSRILNGLDIATLSSAYGEAFPLSIGEAMACEVPCAVTDVGDSAYLVGDTGRVVPPREPAALAAAWDELVLLGPAGRRRLGQAARARIAAHFSLPRVADAYGRLYRQLAGGRPRAFTPREDRFPT